MSDLFLTLAQAPGGLSCFLVPRVLPDGTRNAFLLQRLKDKLGNRSNASAEVEYDGALGWLVGEEGRGVRTIIEMVNMTRLDCALHGRRRHAARRRARRAPRARTARRSASALLDQPAMVNVLADLAVDSEAATTVVHAARRRGRPRRPRRRGRGGVPPGRAGRHASTGCASGWSPHAAEALECLGGNGYVEESGMPRLYREAPLVSIWEGSGNVAALDTLRAMGREPEAIEAFFAELELAAGTDSRYDDALALLRKEFTDARRAASSGPAGSSSGWPCCCRARCCCATAPAAVADAFVRVAAGRRLGRRVRHAARRAGHRGDPRPGQLIRGRSSLGTDSSRIRLFGPLVGTVLISSRVGRTAARGEFAPAIL